MGTRILRALNWDYGEIILLMALAVGLFSLVVRRRDRERSAWPTWLLIPIVIFFTLPLCLAMPIPLLPFRFSVFAIVLGRWVVALVRRERNQGWIFYILLLVVVQFSILPLAEWYAGEK